MQKQDKNNVHDISDLPKDAPRNDTVDNDATVEPETPGRIKNWLVANKKFFIGVGTGIAVGTAGYVTLKAASEDEDEIVVDVEVPPNA